MKQLFSTLAVIAALTSGSTQAQTIFRCGNEYTSLPCPAAKTLVAAAPSTAEQRAEAREVARREKTLAAEMSRDRRAEEARLKPALAGSLSAPRVASVDAKPPARKHPKKRKAGAMPDPDRDFIAIVPKAKKAGI